jgi:hypothetical protein
MIIKLETKIGMKYQYHHFMGLLYIPPKGIGITSYVKLDVTFEEMQLIFPKITYDEFKKIRAYEVLNKVKI